MTKVIGYMRRPLNDIVDLCPRHEAEHRDELMQITHGLHSGECYYCQKEFEAYLNQGHSLEEAWAWRKGMAQ